MPQQGENQQIAAFLIQKEWIPADQVVYYLELAKSTQQTLADLLLGQNLLNPQQAQGLQEFQRNLQSQTKASKNRIPGYKIISKLGTGGMGSVYKGMNLENKKIVAIKILSKQLSDDEEYVRRFMREVKVMRDLNSPNIVQAYDCGIAEGLFYMVMEFVDGVSGYDWLQQTGHTEKELVYIGMQMAAAMTHYEESGMVHRDIKPDNILIAKTGESKLCDLGLAKRENLDTKITATGVTLGTPHYLSPEQARGESLDIRADMYSLGATLFHMATGREPYISKNIIVIMQKHLYDPVPSVREFKPEYSEDFDLLIQKMMAKSKEDRHQTPEDLRRDFETLFKGGHLSLRPSPSKKSTAAVPAVAPKRREKPGDSTDALKKINVKQMNQASTNWPWILIIASLSLVLILLVLFLILRNR